jgi:hypothetical protein
LERPTTTTSPKPSAAGDPMQECETWRRERGLCSTSGLDALAKKVELRGEDRLGLVMGAEDILGVVEG